MATMLPPNAKVHLADLRHGAVNAVAYDRPILMWYLRQSRITSLELSDVTFDPQSYAVAVRSGSPVREQLNVGLLEYLQSDAWKDAQFRYLGRASN